LQAVQQTDLRALNNGNFELLHPSNNYYRTGEPIFRLTGQSVKYQQSLLKNAAKAADMEKTYSESLLNRRKELFNKKFVSPEQWSDLEKNASIARINQQKADSTLGYFLDQIFFKAPFSGRVADVQYQQGAYLQSNCFIGRFYNPDRIKLITDYYDDGNIFQSNMILSILLNDSAQVSAKVLFEEAAVDPQTGGREIWLELSSLPPSFLPGQWIHYKAYGPSRNALAAPAAAILLHNNKYWVMTIRNQKTAPQRVTIGMTQNGWVEIKSGLKEGEWIITQGVYELFYESLKIKYHAQD
jgi:membrane fusion protein (multidrug efflux system)